MKLHDQGMLISAVMIRYENLIQVRCLLEGVDPDVILQNWHTILPEYMEKWKQSRKEVSPSILCFVVLIL